MSFRRQVSRTLDEEHSANLELLGRVERAFGGARDADLASLAGAFGRHVEHELARHFDFEERELFPRMADAGDGDMAELLLEEHVAIRAVAGEILPLARAAAAGTLDEAGWAVLKRGALEMVERLHAHILKETVALLPLVDDLLDEETDRDLSFAYSAG